MRKRFIYLKGVKRLIFNNDSINRKDFIPLTDGSFTCIAIAKQYNFYEFY